MSEDFIKNDLDTMRHSAAHLMAAAVREVMKEEGVEVKFAIGPVIENGFYYDFDLGDRTISADDFKAIEKKMKYLVKQNLPIKKEELSIKDALERVQGQPYKRELISDLAEQGEDTVTFYKLGDVFIDLCRGPHLDSTGKIGAFKILKTAGAYWRGDEHSFMLQRLYGTAFKKQEELDTYLEQLTEAEKRDHRKLGRELDLFTFSDMVGAGLPLFTPRGTIIRNQLQNHLLQISKKYGMQPVTIPHLAKRELYETSGHADKFGDELFKVIGRYDEFVIKPVNCPHHTQIYASKPRSYRDLPIRYMESTMQYRDEKPGEIGGLTRVRAITVDDGHVFCTVDQIREEVKNIVHIIEEFYTGIGLYGNHRVSLSVRDPENLDAYIGENADWEKAERKLQEISNDMNLGVKRTEGEAAIYGPKLDFMFKDSLGREWQLATIQLDFAMPKRFGLEYVDKDGKNKTPIMIHRAILGSYERFLAILIEHFAGAFPVWLSPAQVKVLPISDKFLDYAHEVVDSLKNKDIRAELDDRTESVGKKIRDGELEKIPYLLIVGEREVADKTVAVRKRGEGDMGAVALNDFVKTITGEIEGKR